MDMLITNATVVTCDADGTIVRDGAVAVVDGRIAAVGRTADLERQHPDLERVDASGKAALPGLINSHTHTVLTVIRGTVEDMDVDSVYAYMTPITFAMTDDERGAMAALGCLESIRCGATTLVDPLRFVDGYAQYMVDSGLRLFLSESCADCLTLEIRHGRYEYSREWGEAFLERAERLVERFHGLDGGRVQCQIAAHATENCSPWMLEELLTLARKHGLRRTIHLAQSQAEVRQTAALSGKGSTPAEYLRDNGWLGPDVLAAHWSFCTEDDIAILADSGTHMAHCPASSSRRGSHAGANMPAIVDAGVNVALGTDNMSEDMWQALSVGDHREQGQARRRSSAHAAHDAGVGDTERREGAGPGGRPGVSGAGQAGGHRAGRLAARAPDAGQQPAVQLGPLRAGERRGYADRWWRDGDEGREGSHDERGGRAAQRQGGDAQRLGAAVRAVPGHPASERVPGRGVGKLGRGAIATSIHRCRRKDANGHSTSANQSSPGGHRRACGPCSRELVGAGNTR